jgi:hypothetical protein
MEKLKADLAKVLVKVRSIAGIFSREGFTELAAHAEAIIDDIDGRVKAIDARLSAVEKEVGVPAVAEKPAA